MPSSREQPVVRTITRMLEDWAPPGSAQSYDNVGLQVGRAERHVGRALLALDLTAAVVEEAEAQDAQLIITHHPLIFRPLERVTDGGRESALALRLAEAGIALYSIHTNLDAAPGGVSFALAEELGLGDVRFLDGFSEARYKLATFVPREHLDAVRTALAEAGAGRIGAYAACAFTTEGTGYFRPGAGARPFTGTPAGELEATREVKLEVELDRWALKDVLAALRAAHPYEEVAYDVYPVAQKNTRAGLGAVGRLDTPEPLTDFLRRVAERLDAESLRYAGDPQKMVQTVAVCGGAGSDFTGKALAAGADAYVTADVTYHEFFDVLDEEGAPQMALIDPGHYETEALTEQLLQRHLQEHFPHVDWQCTRTRTSPMQTFTSRR